MERLQKFLANAGVASRRKAEDLITSGRVKVNGRVVTELGTKVDPDNDEVVVDGKTIKGSAPVWVMLHKPRGYVSTRDDPQARPTIYDLLPESLHGLFYVGRLDADSEGLMLLTNHGDVAHMLLHPSFEVSRVYDVLVRGNVKQETVDALLKGIELEDGVARAEAVLVAAGQREGESSVRVTLREGRNREVRRMMAAVGHKVLRLRRISYGPIQLGKLPEGKWRNLSETEVRALPVVKSSGS
jgi:23S rRNA pseudouridine2605 synthase